MNNTYYIYCTTMPFWRNNGQQAEETRELVCSSSAQEQNRQHKMKYSMDFRRNESKRLIIIKFDIYVIFFILNFAYFIWFFKIHHIEEKNITCRFFDLKTVPSARNGCRRTQRDQAKKEDNKMNRNRPIKSLIFLSLHLSSICLILMNF